MSGGFQKATMSNLNPRSLELLREVELGLGSDNSFEVGN